MSFAIEPKHSHGAAAPRCAVLLCNLGTPEAPTPARCAATWPNS